VNPSNDVLAARQMAWVGGAALHSVAAMMQNDLSGRLARDVAGHHYALPVVRELGAEARRRRPSQRDLVVASLMVCDRADRPVHRRWA
jgi:hypothetical protein